MEKTVIDKYPCSFDGLKRLIATLRGENGCPWDRKQTPASLSVYLVEEMYELVEAINADDGPAILEELGDVLFQLFFVAQLYAEAGRFSLDQVLKKIIGKMIHRHPHVFGSEKAETAGQVKQRWQQIKQQEKGSEQSLLDSVPNGMPALMRAYRISERAITTGFDWDDFQGVLAQAEEEWAEFKAEMSEMDNAAAPAEQKVKAAMEFGDVLFTLVNVARLAGIHPEMALSQSTRKFIQRFKYMEDAARKERRSLKAMPREEMEKLWQAAKKADSAL